MESIKNLTAKISGVFLLALLVGGVVYAASFSQPSRNFPNHNVYPPIDESNTNQVKNGDINANKLIGYNLRADEVCLNGDCRTSWPVAGGSSLNTTCTTSSMLKDVRPHTNGNPRSQSGSDLGGRCANYLSFNERNDGWMPVAFDDCSGVQGRDCTQDHYCQYIKIECDAGLTFEQGNQEWRAQTSSGNTDPIDDPGGPGNGLFR